jgi:hypothetical protein
MTVTLMHQNVPVAVLELDEAANVFVHVLEVNAPLHLPVGVFVNGRLDRETLNLWWQGRGIPLSRIGIRDALELLRVSQPGKLVQKCYGLSLSDQYWICPQRQSLNWDEINFFDHAFSEDIGNALFGGTPANSDVDWMSPCSTSDGWLPKRWKIVNGTRMLFKGGSKPYRQEPYNEVLAGSILRRLQIPHIRYELIWDEKEPYSLCEDFITRDTELVPMLSIFKTLPRDPRNSNGSLYQHVLRCCDSLGIPDVRKPLAQMLLVDAMIANTDRHLGNFGAVRNAKTLEWIGLAPVYDSGTSLWCREATADISANAPVLCRPFASTHEQQVRLVAAECPVLNFAALDGLRDEAEQLLAPSRYLDHDRRAAIVSALMARIEAMRKA